MADGRNLPAWIPVPAYRGQHAGGRRARITFVIAGVAALGLVGTVAALAVTGNNTSRSLPPLPARMSPLPMGQVPNPLPSAPPGYPSAIPTGSASGRVPPPTTTRPAPPPPTQPPIAPVSVEAESAANDLTGETRIRPVAGASGGQVIEHIGGDPENSLRFNRIVVPFGGVFTVDIRYISAVDRSAAVSVNDGRFVTVKFPATGDGETVGSLVLRIRLDKGSNSIQFSNPVNYAPDIDRIIVRS
ncbi:hypothetical protein HC031_18385 [Planosporangium thailandense]|uniref:CBM6 domain-containing protein n=1 Tax=Planosporangium thailandense TaxID=765197 RepID=A0ABX0Y0W4_9ACTN|nr:hypothetical protein [Planosporangium thailandense]NJC71673.1 hypothetical protein [Planosporangium thailandense]